MTDFEAKSAWTKKDKKRNRVSKAQVQTLFQILDLDGNGTLDHDEIVGVLEGRQLLGQGKQDEIRKQVNEGVNMLWDILAEIKKKIGL